MSEGKLIAELNATPHRRWNPLLREWILVSPHRTQRPWQGLVEETKPPAAPQHDPNCYLCPGNARAGGHRNPQYGDTFIFENDFAALKIDAAGPTVDIAGLWRAAPQRGSCRVMCFSPQHDLTVSSMTPAALRRVVDVWADQYRELGDIEAIQYVQIFENRGTMMGASSPHPHCQIWASDALPNIPAAEQASLAEYRRESGACLLCAYLELEQRDGARIICENGSFAALVPFWAVWPFELLVISKKHLASIDELSSAARDDLASLMKRLSCRYDNLFQSPFPYSMGFHQKPTDGEAHPEWHFHAHYLPPLLRSATVRKFMVGYELLAEPQRDITPEAAAERLRSVPETELA